MIERCDTTELERNPAGIFAAVQYLADTQGQAPIPMEGFWHFRDARAWRQFARSHDFYFGDRFHGGVVALQAGRPALFVHKDLRVRELTAHFAIPSVALEDISASSLERHVTNAFSARSIEAFHDRYSERLAEYHGLCREAGLEPVWEGHARGRATRPAARKAAMPEWRKDVMRCARAAARKRLVRGAGVPRFIRTVERRLVAPDAAIMAAVNAFARPQAGVRTIELVLRALIERRKFQAADKCLAFFLAGAGDAVTDLPDDACFRLFSLFRAAGRLESARTVMQLLHDTRGRRDEKHARAYASLLIDLREVGAASDLIERSVRNDRMSEDMAERLLARTAS